MAESMYRGPDRRRATYVAPRDPLGWQFALAAVLILGATAATLADRDPLGRPDGELEQRFALIAAVIVASSVAFLVLRWRLTTHNTSLWIAVAQVGAGVTMVASETTALGFGDGSGARSLPLAAAVATLCVAWRVAAVPEIDSGVHGRRVLFALAGLLAALVVGTVVLDAVGVGLPAKGADAHVVTSSLLAAAWAGAALIWWRAGGRRREWALVWGSLLFAALAGRRLASAVASATEVQVGVAGTVLLAVGGVVALRGSVESLRETMEAQGRELQATRDQINEGQSQADRARAAAEERAHEARNALQAVGAAIQTLERFHERLDEETKHKLSTGVAFELERLQRLIDLDEHAEPLRPFSVNDALHAVVIGALGGGLDVDVDVPADLVAVGQPQATAGIVQNLLVNAQRHAGGKNVSLRARRDRDRVVVVVSDGGPGVPPSEREAVFVRSHCSETTGGSGFGLYVSRRLARAQGGDLWVTDRAGGGAMFGFDLALAGAAARVGDEGHKVGDAGRS